MSERVQGVLVAVVGAAALYLAVSTRHLDFLKGGMRLPLLGAGLVTLVLGVATFVRATAGGHDHADGDDHHTGHDHADGDDHHAGHGHAGHGPGVGWLLLLPVVAVLVVRPPALGADAARRDSPRPPSPVEREFDPLPPARDGAVDMAVAEFRTRAFYNDDHLAGATVRLTGFVVGDPTVPDGYLLTRFTIVCCAADALPAQIAVQGLEEPPPPDDTWVEIVGEQVPPIDPTVPPDLEDIAIAVHTQSEIPPPTQPYE